MQPLAYAYGLARAAIAAGARIYTETPVTRGGRNGAAFVLDATAPLEGLSAAAAIAPPFLFSIAVLAVLAIAFLLYRDLLRAAPEARTGGAPFDWRALLADRRLMAGAGAIFAYVGAEVAIGALLTNYLVLPDVIAAEPIGAPSDGPA